MRRIILVLLLLCALALPASSATIYVDDAASSTTPPCTSGSPCTKAYALANAVAGDEVRIMAGTYVGEWHPANNGTPGNRIKFLADPAAGAGTVILQNGYTSNHQSGEAGTIRFVQSGVGKSWIQIGPGLTFSGDLWPPQIGGCTGGGCIEEQTYGHNLVIGNNFTSTNSSGTGGSPTFEHGNNSMLSGLGRDAVVTRNTFSNAGTAIYNVLNVGTAGPIVTGNVIQLTGTGDTGGLEWLGSLYNGAWITNNYLVASGSMDSMALWCDQDGENSHIYNNYVFGNFTRGAKDEQGCNNNTWKYNIFNGMTGGTGALSLSPTADGAYNSTWLHNTIYDSFGFVVDRHTDITVRNNIMANGGVAMSIDVQALNAGSQQTIHGSDFDYNLYCPSSGCSAGSQIIATTTEGNSSSTPDETLAQWRITSGDDANSAVGSPLFVSPSGHNFTLGSGSPGIGTGEGGTNKGACPGNSIACGAPSTAPVVTLVASPSTITVGKSATLTWSSPTPSPPNFTTPTSAASLNALNPCSATFTESTGSYGQTLVRPTTTTTYSMTCTNTQGSTQADVTVTVLPAPSTPNPVAWWKLNESGGATTAVDTMGTQNATTVNSPTWAGGQLGNALVLNGSTQYATATNTAALNPTGLLTIAAWINANDTTSSAHLSKGLRPTPVRKGQYEIGSRGHGSSRYVRCTIEFDDAFEMWTASSLFSTGAWHHIACVYDGTSWTVYLDGVLDSGYPITRTMADNGANVLLGARYLSPTAAAFPGSIDDARIYNAALTPGDVAAIMTATALPPVTTITGPTSSSTYSTGTSPLTTLAGTVDISVSSVTVACVPSCGSPSVTGTTSWSVASIPLTSGLNKIYVTATDSFGQRGVDQLDVTYTPAGSASPTIVITTDGGNGAGVNFSTSTTPLTTLAGTAADDVGVTSVTVACSPSCGSPSVTCGTCGASGTSVTWSVSSLSLTAGANVITATAHDGDTQTGTDSITVTYNPPADLTTNLVAYYKLNEVSGTTANDSSGQTQHGALVGFPASPWTNGHVLGGLTIDGVDAVVTVPASAVLNDFSTLSLAAWIHPTSFGPGSTNPRIFHKTGAWWFAVGNDTGQEALFFQADRWATNVGCWQTPIGSIDLNVDTHVAVTYSFGSTSNIPVMYINGTAQTVTDAGCGTPSGSLSAETGVLHLGNRADQARPFVGWLDEMRVYGNRILGQADVDALVAFTESVAPTTSPVAPGFSAFWAR